ncbi:DUF4123 domain-containing protein [Brenneria roseae subsp. roseae]|uniref:DUF4123 domain-containing protein n=1 Tax=Brenneria roseae TaxID=1509241 RepID=UPI000D615020|nr:DUF4123 domain-containing protein [Brenneria roseae]PWC16571.1 DUF4123 domain-containing protein [Brenneria roseae subsp. roseae]
MSESSSFLSRTSEEDESGWQARIAQGGCFMLAEAALNDAVPWLAERWGGSLEQTRLYWGETGRIHASVSPYCIPVHSVNWSQLREYLLVQDGWGIAIQLEWFMQAYSPLQQLTELMKHLREWSWVATPKEENVILRISDWLVTSSLLEASDAREACALFGPVKTFCAIAPSGSVQTLTLTERQTHDLSGRAPQHLSQRQWQAIIEPSERGVLNEYMAHLRAHHIRWREIDEPALLDFTQRQVEQARRHGFDNDRDIVRYLSLATEMESDFVRQPWAEAVFAEPEMMGMESRMDRLYRAALAQLDNEKA